MSAIKQGKTIFIKRCSQCHTIEQGKKLQLNCDIENEEQIQECKSMQFYASKPITKEDITAAKEANSLLKRLEANPRQNIPGKELILAGIKKKNERMCLIAYLKDSKSI